MESKNQEELILDYLQEPSGSKRSAKLKEQLLNQGINESELNHFRAIFAELGDMATPKPDMSAQAGFYSMLEKHKRQMPEQKVWYRHLKKIFETPYLPRLAYALLILVVGWLAGYWYAGNGQNHTQIEYLSSEIRQMKKMISLTMLNQNSPAERIKNLNTMASFPQGDSQIIEALIKTLNTDGNINVRLSAVEALYKLADDSRVRAGLIHALTNQKSPLVQLALVECYVALQEKQAVGHLKQLLDDKELNDVVKNQIEQSLKILI